MKNKVISLSLTMVMICSLFTSVMAYEPFDVVDTKGALQVEETGKEITSETGSTISVFKSDSESSKSFDFLYTLDMQNVRNKFDEYYSNWNTIIEYAYSDPASIDEMNRKLDALHVTGQFDVAITYPKSFVIPESFLENGKMIGFDENAKRIFSDDVRTITEGTDNNILTISIKLLGEEAEGVRPGYVLVKEVKENITSYLSDFTIRCDGVEIPDLGTFIVETKMTGYTNIAGNSLDIMIDYKTEPITTSAKCIINKKSAGSGLSAGNVSSSADTYIITFDIDGDTSVIKPINKKSDSMFMISEAKVPYKEGYVFNGWYTDATLQNKLTDSIKSTNNLTLYGTWKEIASVAKLNDTEHFAYVLGFPDGTVRPNNNITREEVAALFFRLLKEEEKESLVVDHSVFPDVESERWSNTAISTMAAGGYITGYPDGSFGPSKYITRAEFVTIASRLDTLEDAAVSFSDVSGYWAEDYIANAAAKGWVGGYTDGTFRPEQYITRAEAITIINRMLKRFVNEDGLHSDASIWSDNDKDAWYYYAIEEATNSHEYERQADRIYETWTSVASITE